MIVSKKKGEEGKEEKRKEKGASTIQVRRRERERGEEYRRDDGKEEPMRT